MTYMLGFEEVELGLSVAVDGLEELPEVVDVARVGGLLCFELLNSLLGESVFQ
jgi:hypothetical protein